VKLIGDILQRIAEATAVSASIQLVGEMKQIILARAQILRLEIHPGGKECGVPTNRFDAPQHPGFANARKAPKNVTLVKRRGDLNDPVQSMLDFFDFRITIDEFFGSRVLRFFPILAVRFKLLILMDVGRVPFDHVQLLNLPSAYVFI
ncbi:MAG: hypothetical protein ACRENG_21790, partial [bacterium]